MTRNRLFRLPFIVFCLFTFPRTLCVADETLESEPERPSERVAWTTSRVIGSPDPPLPYAVARQFSDLELKSPIYLAPEPGTNSLMLIQSANNNGTVLRFDNTQEVDQATTILEIPDRLVYGLTFHDSYVDNGFIYVFSNGPTGQSDRANRVTRYRVARESPFAVDLDSKLTIIEWASAGHDGGDLAFGNDGMLYVTSGDGTSDSDTLVSGQDVSNLLATLIRIDVDHPSEGRNYRVPPDNPFVGMKNVRPEIWAFGFRNPWRMTIDRPSNQIWVGNNGQDLWETAYLVRRGDNYGWSVYEGNHPFYLNRRTGPAPIVAPTVEHHHREARSLTGGVVYRGRQLPELDGAYIYGDYSTGKIWGIRHDGTSTIWHRELADTTLQIAAFRVDQNEHLLIVDHGGGIYRLKPRPKDPRPPPSFPRKLSETGLFESVRDHRLHPAVIPYEVNSPMWADGAEIDRFLAIPGDGRIDYRESGAWELPDGAVLLQTLSLETEIGNPRSRRRLETRLMTRQQNEWAGYSYRWNQEQTDAVLVPSDGADVVYEIIDRMPNQNRRQTWRYPSRAECMACHSRAANYVLGLTQLQLNRRYGAAGEDANQIAELGRMGLFKQTPPGKLDKATRLANPYDDATGTLEKRARAYLHVNCASCHVEAGGGNAAMQLQLTTPAEKTGLFYVRPLHSTFAIDNAMLIAPGDPSRSVLLHRLSLRGSGQMPPLVSNRVDLQAVDLFHAWIEQMQPTRPFVRDWKMQDIETELDEVTVGRSFENGRAAFQSTGCLQCHRFQTIGGSTGPDLTSVGTRLNARQLLESLIEPSEVIPKEFANIEIETVDGRVYVGRIQREDEANLVMRTTAKPDTPIQINLRDVEHRGFSRISNMPTGTINSLCKSDILDLLAYLIADGEPDHFLWKGQD